MLQESVKGILIKLQGYFKEDCSVFQGSFSGFKGIWQKSMGIPEKIQRCFKFKKELKTLDLNLDTNLKGWCFAFVAPLPPSIDGLKQTFYHILLASSPTWLALCLCVSF